MPACLAPCIVPEIDNGRMEGMAVGNTLEHGAVVAINCSRDYEASSYEDITCNNGTWSSVPKCIPARWVTRVCGNNDYVLCLQV